MRNIAVVTGTRAEYGTLKPVLRAIAAKPGLKLSLIAAGMHLSHAFGYTVREIEDDGFDICARVKMAVSSDTLAGMAQSVGSGISAMAETWEQLKPDVILVIGDRTEPLAATIAGAYMNIPVAHIHGGDDCGGGTIDDSNRHAITRFAHIHFPATRKSAERIIRMGEEEWRVHMVGSPALDAILNEPLLPGKVLIEKLGLTSSGPLILVIQHPVTTQADEAPEQMRETLRAIEATGYPAVVIYPNSDAGGRRMIEVIEEYQTNPLFKIFKSLPRNEYLSLVKMAGVIAGNSSSGLLDAPSLGIPVVNIGIRQGERERGCNVIDVGHDRQEIVKAIERAISDKEFLAEVRKCESPYGDGQTSRRIADILSELEITPQLLQKKVSCQNARV